MARPSLTAGVLLAAAALTAWGLVGTFGPRPGYTDALFEPDYTILHAPAGSPLAEAGFAPGDSVVTVEGIPVVQLGMYSRWPRDLARQPGESLRMVVERDGERVVGDVVFREQRPGALLRRATALAVGLAFLWLGVWTFLALPSAHSAQLLAMGLAMAVALPAADLGTWNGVRDHLQTAGSALWALFLLGFFLTFPAPKTMVRKRSVRLLLFAPWVLLVGALVLELVFHPRFYHTFGPFAGLLVVGYVALALVAATHTAVRTPRRELQTSGMMIILVALGVAAVPNLVAIVAWFISPERAIPGQAWFPLLFVLVPLGMALAVRRRAMAAAR